MTLSVHCTQPRFKSLQNTSTTSGLSKAGFASASPLRLLTCDLKPSNVGVDLLQTWKCHSPVAASLAAEHSQWAETGMNDPARVALLDSLHGGGRRIRPLVTGCDETGNLFVGGLVSHHATTHTEDGHTIHAAVSTQLHRRVNTQHCARVVVHCDCCATLRDLSKCAVLQLTRLAWRGVSASGLCGGPGHSRGLTAHATSLHSVQVLVMSCAQDRIQHTHTCDNGTTAPVTCLGTAATVGSWSQTP